VPADPAALLAAIVTSTDDAIVGKRLDGQILSWNHAAEQIFGWSAEEMVGRNVRDLIPADRQSEEDAIIASISAGRRMPTFETVRNRKDGSTVLVAVTVSPVLDADGRVIAASKIARDITEQTRLRVSIAASEERFRLLADNISQLAWIADASGSHTWFNQRWFEYTGTTFEEMEGWGWIACHHPDHVADVLARFRRSFASGEPCEQTFPLRGASGEWRWFLTRAMPIRGSDGTISCWFGTNTDVTEMRDAEQRIDTLLQEVNHRTKNMLAIIQSMARRSNAAQPDFVGRLEQRIRGIAANQDVLVRHTWSQIPIDEALDAQLRFLGEESQRVSRHGPALCINSGAAEALAMAINEMAMNAMRHGALSVATGSVALRWQVDESRLIVSWQERDGPNPDQAPRRGFGTRIICDVPRVKFDAEIDMQFDPAGFRWAMSCPLSKVS